MKRITMMLAAGAIFIFSAHGQGFLNLNFESAQNLPGNPGNGTLVSTTDALPGWNAYNGPNALANVYYTSNVIYGTAAAVGLEGGSLALSDNWSVELFDGSSISQTGSVPDNAKSLQFEAGGPESGLLPGATGFSVTIGGQKLSYSALANGPNYIEYGANIPADLEGQMEALIFGCQGVGSGNVLLDNIEFSTSAIPEPSEYALIGLGAILFGLHHFRKGPAKKIQPIQG